MLVPAHAGLVVLEQILSWRRRPARLAAGLLPAMLTLA